MRYWSLMLNPMRGNSEEMHVIACATNPDILLAFIERETVEPYSDSASGIPDSFTGDLRVWNKNFRKGGPLEWYNPIEHCLGFGGGIQEMGSKEEYLKIHSDKWDNYINKYEIK